MTRTFEYEFSPAYEDPVQGPKVELTVQEIEDAGLREVLQTPGAPLTSWSFLGDLLRPGDPFVFHEPLGQAREVKIALSGLFGRFVARAYLERYFKLAVFHHLGQENIKLNGARRIFVVSNVKGDRPDWIACSKSFSDLTVAEAKGTHDKSGPARALSRAREQVQRVDVVEQGQTVPVKRIAIATRWGMAAGGPGEPRIAVHDPDDEGDLIETGQQEAIFVGLYRHHTANMICRLGHSELASALRKLTTADTRSSENRASDYARRLVEDPRDEFRLYGEKYRHLDDLIGGVVTRAGPMTAEVVSQMDPSELVSINLRPVFVGVHRDVLSTVIDGDLDRIREALRTKRFRGREGYRSDGVGSWFFPLDRES